MGDDSWLLPSYKRWKVKECLSLWWCFQRGPVKVPLAPGYLEHACLSKESNSDDLALSLCDSCLSVLMVSASSSLVCLPLALSLCLRFHVCQSFYLSSSPPHMWPVQSPSKIVCYGVRANRTLLVQQHACTCKHTRTHSGTQQGLSYLLIQTWSES